MLIMNLLHLAAMQKFLFVVYLKLTLPVSDVLAILLHLDPSKGPVMMEHSLYS